ncbi:MAG: type II toxin-antitoxin system RelE family toxin [Rhabdochlamydiaceae bacterium]
MSKKAGKSALKMPKHYQKRIKEFLLALENDPVPAKLYDTDKMGDWEHAYRVRIGDIRITYRIFWDLHEIKVLEIEWRGKAY